MPISNYHDENKILQNTIDTLSGDTGITQLSPGGKARAILEAFAREQGSLAESFDLEMAQAFVRTSNGDSLDLIGEIVGIVRLEAQSAEIDAAHNNIKFYVISGTFGDINDGVTATVPAGTLLYANQTSIAGSRTTATYRLTANVDLLPTATEAYVSAVSTQTGTKSTVGIGAINTHGYSDYEDVANSTLKITNVSGIVGGSNRESDTNFRYRVSNAIVASEAANIIAVRLAALGVAGVADVTMIPYDRGSGTFTVLIKALYPIVSDALIEQVQQAINRIKAFGNSGISRAPKNVGIQMTVTLRYRTEITEDQKVTLETVVEDEIINYCNNLAIGEEFSTQELIRRILNTSNQIKSIGTSSKPFDDIYIYRDSRLSDNRVKQTLLADYSAHFDERVIVEQSISSPITVRSE